MTFDELWRLELAGKRRFKYSIDEPAEKPSIDGPGSSDFAFDDLDETDMNRFLEWLETSLLSDSSENGV
jgi:uncharacterized protein YegL